MVLQEVLRISQDADYLSPGLRARAVEVVEQLKPALFTKLKVGRQGHPSNDTAAHRET